MQKHEIHTTGTDTSYDYDFDFDFDLRLNLFDYVLLAFYAVFVFPFVLFGGLVARPALEYIRKRKEGDVGSKLGIQSSVSTGPYCTWPRVTNG